MAQSHIDVHSYRNVVLKVFNRSLYEHTARVAASYLSTLNCIEITYLEGGDRPKLARAQFWLPNDWSCRTDFFIT